MKRDESRKERDESREKRDESRFSRVHWKYQNFAFTGIRNLFSCFSIHTVIVSIIAVDTSFHCRQRCMCTMCVLLKSSTVHQYCFIHVYIGQTFFKVRHVGVCRLTCCQCRDCAHKMSTQQHTPTLEHAKPRFSHLTKFLFKLEHSLRT